MRSDLHEWRDPSALIETHDLEAAPGRPDLRVVDCTTWLLADARTFCGGGAAAGGSLPTILRARRTPPPTGFRFDLRSPTSAGTPRGGNWPRGTGGGILCGERFASGAE